MRIFIVSHSCVTPVNQEVYIHLQNLPDTEVALLTPQNWISDISGEAQHTRLHPELNYPVWQSPVFRPGQVWQHFYTQLPVAKNQRISSRFYATLTRTLECCELPDATLGKEK